MKNKLPIWVGFTFVLYLAFFFVFQLITQDSEFSELENRTLAQKPTLTLDGILDGSFGEAYETYIADQFPLRNQMISLKANSERVLQKKENNGVFLGKDGYLLQDFERPDMELALRNAGYINELAQKFNIYVGLAPTATKILEDHLPAFASPYDEGQYISDFYQALSPKVHKVSILETIEAQAINSNDQLYYKTDHHWTTLGAYYGYTSFCKAAGIKPYPLSDFTITTVSETFYGSLFSKGNFTFIDPDSLQLFYPNFSNPLTVTYEENGSVSDSLYEYSHLEKKDKYSVFLDNNHPLIRIKTSIKNGRKLMVIKDSYANSLIPFLTNHYEAIDILDLRFLTMPLQTYATQNHVDDILLLYNVHNFSAEGKLSLLLR